MIRKAVEIMGNLTEKYRLSSNLTKKQLIDSGFDRFGIYKKWLYGKSVQLEITVDYEEMNYTYMVNDVCNGQLYIPYYNNIYGRNDVLGKVISKVNGTFKELSKKGIFIYV